MIRTIKKFVEGVKRGQIEIYNEFSLQHELGILIRSEFPDHKVEFGRNVSYFFRTGKFVKKEIDLAVFSPDKSILHHAIQLRFPRSMQYLRQMFGFCEDILFLEQLKKSGFKQASLVIFTMDPLLYSGDADGLCASFREKKRLHGSVQRTTGTKIDTIELSGSYEVQWNTVFNGLKYTVIEANDSHEVHSAR